MRAVSGRYHSSADKANRGLTCLSSGVQTEHQQPHLLVSENLAWEDR